ncbi:hypothetical protein EJB05_18425, partial [Eragrostis curvula]
VDSRSAALAAYGVRDDGQRSLMLGDAATGASEMVEVAKPAALMRHLDLAGAVMPIAAEHPWPNFPLETAKELVTPDFVNCG